jgi:hypothetical protein
MDNGTHQRKWQKKAGENETTGGSNRNLVVKMKLRAVATEIW